METILGLRKYCEGFSQINADSYNSIFEYCKKSFTSQGVFVNMERLNSLNMTKFITQDSKESVDVPLRIRLVLQTMSKDSKKITPIGQIAHGMVLEIVESDKFLQLNILAYPVPHIPNIFRYKDVEIKLCNSEYDIYEMEDGTTCNIYYDKNYVFINEHQKYQAGKWMFATRKSYDIEKFEFMGEQYKNVLRDVLLKYPDFSFDKLIPGNTYTIGFKHPAHHPLNQPAEWNPNSDINWVMKAWLISIHDSDGNILDTDIGIPKQIPISENPTMGFMQEKCKSALRDHSVGPNRSSFFGYILRSKNPGFNRVAHVCMDSRLFTELRQNLYNLERRMIKYPGVNFKRKENVILAACLSYEKRKIFFNLFPQFIRYESMINEILHGVARKILNRPVKSSYDEIITNIYQKISRNVSISYKPTGNYEQDMFTVMGLITYYSYIHIYSALIFN